MAAALGLIAGAGLLPREVARAVRRGGRGVVAVGFRGVTDPALEAEVASLRWLALGEARALIDHFRGSGVRDAVLAGKVSKTRVFLETDRLQPDSLALEILGRLPDRRDDTLLAAFADALEAHGIQVRSQVEPVPELLGGAGLLGAARPGAAQWQDIRFGWSVARAMAQLDVGQSVVVKGRAVICVEALEGTDAAIRRAGDLAGAGSSVVKVAKPAQDPRFDVPTIGPGTLAAMIDAGATALAFEAQRTLVLGRRELVERADACGIAVVGISDAAGDLQ